METLKIKLVDYLETLPTRTLVEVFLVTPARTIPVVVYSVIIQIIKHRKLNNLFQERFTIDTPFENQILGLNLGYFTIKL